MGAEEKEKEEEEKEDFAQTARFVAREFISLNGALSERR